MSLDGYMVPSRPISEYRIEYLRAVDREGQQARLYASIPSSCSFLAELVQYVFQVHVREARDEEPAVALETQFTSQVFHRELKIVFSLQDEIDNWELLRKVCLDLTAGRPVEELHRRNSVA